MNKSFIKKYPLLPEQKTMLENLLPLFKSSKLEDLCFVRDIVMNEPLLNIIVGTPTCKQNMRTLQNRVQHCKPNSEKFKHYLNQYKLFGEYYYMAKAIEATLKYGYYYLWK